MFKTNVGGIDRVLRIVAGLVLIGLTLMGIGWLYQRLLFPPRPPEQAAAGQMPA